MREQLPKEEILEEVEKLKSFNQSGYGEVTIECLRVINITDLNNSALFFHQIARLYSIYGKLPPQIMEIIFLICRNDEQLYDKFIAWTCTDGNLIRMQDPKRFDNPQ